MHWLKVAAILGCLGVILGAFGAHYLKGRIEEGLLAAYHTGVLYHLIHAVALLALVLYGRAQNTPVTLPAALFVIGVLLFSGSLYTMAFTGVRALGAITPFGGLAFIAGWVSLVWQR